MTRRRLTPDEIELWRRVTRTTQRTHSAHPAREDHPRPAPLPKPKPPAPPAPRIEPFAIGESARPAPPSHDLRSSVTRELMDAPMRMDRKTYQRMTRGKLKPQARLDLHGHRLESAHSRLIRFVLSSQASGHRLVLVITGKGKSRDGDQGPIPSPRGVLRHQVPQWLSLPPLAQAVLQVTPAHRSHGGEGAYYVYLRRP